MKRIYILSILFFAVTSLYAESFKIPGKTVQSPLNAFQKIENAQSVNMDLTNKTIMTNNKNFNNLQGTLDTLYDYVKRSTGVNVYGVTIQGNTYPMTGYNPTYVMLGEKYEVSGDANVKELLFSAMGKQQLGSYSDTLVAIIYGGDPITGLPSTQIGSGGILFSQIDTNSKTPVFTSIKFSTNQPVNGKFVCTLLTFNNTNEYDALLLFSNLQGDGKNEKNMCVIYFNNNQLLTSNFYDYYSSITMQDGNPPNFDALIFPIIEKTSSSINDALTLNGLTLKNASPNPAQDHITLDINIEHSSFITVDVVSNDGKVLQTITKENCLSGNHQITLDLSGLNSGSYYYLVKTNFTQFGSKFTIVK